MGVPVRSDIDDRRREVVTVPDGNGRDSGKLFLVTEWPASVAEKWAIRFLLACTRGSENVSIDAIAGRGWEAIAVVGFSTLLRGRFDPEEVIPLLDQLLDCVRCVRDPGAVDQMTGLPVATPVAAESDLAEVRTRLWLRSEVVRVHSGFSPADLVGQLLSSPLTRPPGADGSPST